MSRRVQLRWGSRENKEYNNLLKYKILSFENISTTDIFYFTEEGHNFYLRALSESLKSI